MTEKLVAMSPPSSTSSAGATPRAAPDEVRHRRDEHQVRNEGRADDHVRTVIVLVVLALGFWSCHRLRRCLLPMAIIAGVLVGALAFLPWSLNSAPA